MATLQLFGRKKDRETQRGERWLRERRIVFSYVDLDAKPLSPGEAGSIAKAIGGFDRLLDREGSFYQHGGWSHREFDAREELAEHPRLVKVPILRLGSVAIVGFDETQWKSLVWSL